jgi:hypothetical protein
MEAVLGVLGLLLIVWLAVKVILLQARLSGYREALKYRPQPMQGQVGNNSSLLPVVGFVSLFAFCLLTALLIAAL